MEKQKCKKCPKVVEGYSKKHVEYLMMQHDIKHRMEEKKQEKQK